MKRDSEFMGELFNKSKKVKTRDPKRRRVTAKEVGLLNNREFEETVHEWDKQYYVYRKYCRDINTQDNTWIESTYKFKHFGQYSDLAKITKLDISGIAIKELPITLCNLSLITDIRLENNLITKFPYVLLQMPNIVKLYLQANEIDSIPDDIGYKMPNLEIINMDDNNLTELPSSIGYLTKLIELSLEANELIYLPPEIGNCTNLTSLYIGLNMLRKLPDTLKNLFRLKYLDISYNHSIEIPDIIFTTATSIKRLAMYEVDAISIPLSIFNLPLLEELDISKNCISLL